MAVVPQRGAPTMNAQRDVSSRPGVRVHGSKFVYPVVVLGGPLRRINPVVRDGAALVAGPRRAGGQAVRRGGPDARGGRTYAGHRRPADHRPDGRCGAGGALGLS